MIILIGGFRVSAVCARVLCSSTRDEKWRVSFMMTVEVLLQNGSNAYFTSVFNVSDTLAEPGSLHQVTVLKHVP